MLELPLLALSAAFGASTGVENARTFCRKHEMRNEPRRAASIKWDDIAKAEIMETKLLFFFRLLSTDVKLNLQKLFLSLLTTFT